MNNRFSRVLAELLKQATNVAVFAKVGLAYLDAFAFVRALHSRHHFARNKMVAGLKEGNRVKGLAIKLFGQQKAQNLFPRSFKKRIVRGVVVKKGQGRKMVVKWDFIDETSSVSSRLLDHDDKVRTRSDTTNTTETVDASAAASAVEDAVASVESVATTQNDAIEDSDSELPENPAFDEAEVEGAANPGDELLRPHNCLWHTAPQGVTVDVPDRAKMGPHIKWRDGLDNERSPLAYFLKFHPDHLGAGGTLNATNSNLLAAGCREMTRQEYFVYCGIIYAMSFYPKFTVRELFSLTAEIRRSTFIEIPDLSKYMAFSRYNDITNNLAFITNQQHLSMGNTEAFWQVQPLVDAFNYCRQEVYSPGAKVVVDESIFEWKGKDQRYGIDGCPHVTKIIRKPKGVGMEAKNLACCDTGIMLAMEMMAPKEEMRQREYCARYGSGTALLLRLTESLRGTGRVVVADSAFASVKSACALKTHLGLYFQGLVKTAHRMFPKKYLQTVEIPERGGHVVLTSKILNVELRAVAWNDGKKDKKTGQIIRKNIVASCGITIPGVGHRKRRWTVDDTGHAHLYLKNIPRPQLVEDYFEGAQKIDVHNHLRQGRAGVALERRPAKTWVIRFFQSYLGTIEVDSFLAYRYFCPGKGAVRHSTFLRVLTQELLDNRIGCAHDAPVLRSRTSVNPDQRGVHSLRILRNAKYYVAKTAAAVAIGSKPPQCVLKCRICGKNASMFCLQCSGDTTKCRMICALCGPKTGRDCFDQHQECTELVDPI